MAVGLIMLLAAIPAVFAAQHTVGGTSGWTTPYDYTTWSSGETFVVGDTLLFTYDSTHSVDQVSQSDYTNCASSSAINSYTGGNNVVNLTSDGPVYFICPTPGHCSGGMKLTVTVTASNTTTPSPPGTPPSPTNPTESPPPPPSPPPESNGATRNFFNMNRLMLGLSVVLGVVFAFMG